VIFVSAICWRVLELTVLEDIQLRNNLENFRVFEAATSDPVSGRRDLNLDIPEEALERFFVLIYNYSELFLKRRSLIPSRLRSFRMRSRKAGDFRPFAQALVKNHPEDALRMATAAKNACIHLDVIFAKMKDPQDKISELVAVLAAFEVINRTCAIVVDVMKAARARAYLSGVGPDKRRTDNLYEYVEDR
jgi:hypothetical protein